MNRSIETRLAHLEKKVAPPVALRSVRLFVRGDMTLPDRVIVPRGETADEARARHIAEHPEDADAHFTIFTVVSPPDYAAHWGAARDAEH